MNDLGGILALIFGAGLVGGFLVARLTSGVRALFGWLLWLALPFLVLAFLLAVQSDPSLPPERSSYNFAFGFVLIGMIMAVPWLLANLIGGLVGWLFKRRAAAAAAVPETNEPLATDQGLPDWSKADNPSLSLAELGALMHGAAELADIDKRLLPHIGPAAERDGVFLDRDKFDYIYIGYERGEILFDHRGVIADHILYLVFRDQAFPLASSRLAGKGIPDAEFAGRLAAEQAVILGAIDPAWERQFVHERGLRAGG